MRRFSMMVTSCLLLVVLCSIIFTGTASAQVTHRTSATQSTHAQIPACGWVKLNTANIYDGTGHYLGYAIFWFYECNSTVHTETVSAIGSATLESIASSSGGYSDLQCGSCTLENSDSVPFVSGNTAGYGYINGWGVEVF